MFHRSNLNLSRGTGMLALLSLFLGACATVPDTAVPDTAAPMTTSQEEAAPFAAAPAPEPQFRPTAPERYVVRQGDTLWDIANTFLRNPAYWPEIWLVNPQVRNPHRIYPGDVLSIYYVDGRGRVMVDLLPRVRIESLDSEPFAISTLQPFMFRPRVVDEQSLSEAPYIVASQDERSIFGAGDRVYVRNAPDAERYDLYHVVRRDRMLVDPDTGEELGVATIPIGEAEIVRSGEIATAVLRNSDRESVRGDRLIGFDDDPDLLFDISRPPVDLEGQVVLLFDAITQVGKLQAVVINRGERDGVRNGQVFSAWEAGRTTLDPISGKRNDIIDLPEEEIGTVMIFRTFEKVAYALVTRSERPLREGFKVRHP
jgi:hypothetical protein